MSCAISKLSAFFLGLESIRTFSHINSSFWGSYDSSVMHVQRECLP